MFYALKRKKNNNILLEINQKVQSSTTNAIKVHSNSDLTGRRSMNSTNGRERKKINNKKQNDSEKSILATRSRGSITMRMLMGMNGIYANGKIQPMTANGMKTLFVY